MNYSQKYFVIMGIIFLFMSGFMILTGIMTHSAPPAITYPLLGMMIMSFCLSYLHPQFKEKDERMKLIRYKGMFFSFFALIAYYLLFSFGLNLKILTLSATELLNILMALTMSTVFISFVVLSKRY
ncbi:permease [Bacillus sp. GX]|uniref:Permease n=1 Tax=Bacillus albus TaxID=2026189 RepID=A0ABM7E6A5_9BACI|nr:MULTISPECIES: permease [Bacillus]AZQ48594.1 permease [Bacillus albus]MDA2261047.1 permease [Bacillus cereus group sp. Bc200]MDA2321702.1 permease [Bacillus cereus group sp. Bc177]UPL45569.1 permease [Bacillus sp. PGP15]WPU76210.1 permease [Bacillus sp. RA(2023)]